MTSAKFFCTFCAFLPFSRQHVSAHKLFLQKTSKDTIQPLTSAAGGGYNECESAAMMPQDGGLFSMMLSVLFPFTFPAFFAGPIDVP